MAKRISEEGIFIGDIVKEYPNMFKIIIYHDGYYLPSSDRKEIKKVNKETRRQDSIHRSLRRTKTTIKDIMLCNRFDYWCTFTYNCRSCYPKCDNNPCTCNPSTCQAIRHKLHASHAPKLVQESKEALAEFEVLSSPRVSQKRRNPFSLHDIWI